MEEPSKTPSPTWVLDGALPKHALSLCLALCLRKTGNNDHTQFRSGQRKEWKGERKKGKVNDNRQRAVTNQEWESGNIDQRRAAKRVVGTPNQVYVPLVVVTSFLLPGIISIRRPIGG